MADYDLRHMQLLSLLYAVFKMQMGNYIGNLISLQIGAEICFVPTSDAVVTSGVVYGINL